MLPGILVETADERSGEWLIRVVPNKFPIVQQSDISRCGPAETGHRAGGLHEVIVESPRHDADLTTLTTGELEAVVCAYRERSRHLLSLPGIHSVVLFRNAGRQAGASLGHPHAQIVATSFVPPAIAEWADWGRRYHAESGRCATCDELKMHMVQNDQVVEETGLFIAVVPFAAAHPFEQWVVPKAHEASFADGSGTGEFSALLRRCLERLARSHDDPDYRFVVDTAPGSERPSPYLHWKLRIVPELTRAGGFELGAGMAVNPSDPAQDAVALRGAIAR